MALALELKYEKDEILSLYLNRVYLGAGAVGFEAAAEEARSAEREAQAWREPLQRLLATGSIREAGELLDAEGAVLLREDVALEGSVTVRGLPAGGRVGLVRLTMTSTTAGEPGLLVEHALDPKIRGAGRPGRPRLI